MPLRKRGYHGRVSSPYHLDAISYALIELCERRAICLPVSSRGPEHFSHEDNLVRTSSLMD